MYRVHLQLPHPYEPSCILCYVFLKKILPTLGVVGFVDPLPLYHVTHTGVHLLFIYAARG
jgi:hypothetical protein